jgi:hypothetical protein
VDESELLARIEGLHAELQGPPFDDVHARLQALDAVAEEMKIDLCEFARQRAPHFLPYYYLLEGAHACDDPAIPLWVRDQVRAVYGAN